MHLKRLKVRNFKSFAGSTEIPFQPGFTGVAGPNGMGKSNISDAILFVLGPTSSKALRADRLTHLFFNGGSSKKAATECEVSLVFDNKDRLLPVETDDVELTRYVKLAPSDANGYYSYFYVNGKRSTQTEMDSLLSHARLSGDGYNLVQQGDVNRIVSMGTVPRRGLVERLAGISQYDEELQRADGKRAELETNLGQINALLTEIKSHLTALESQRLQAIQYKQLQDERKRAEARLARAGHRMMRQEVDTCSKHLGELRTELEGARAAAQKLEDERGHVTQAIERVEQEIAKLGGPDAVRFKTELDERRMAFARLDENVRTAQAELETLATESTELAGRLEADGKELDALKKKEKASAEKFRASDAKLKLQAEALSAATASADPSHGKLAGTRKEILRLEGDQDRLQTAWQSAIESREETNGRLTSAERDAAQLEDDQRTREIELKDLELRVKETRPGGSGGKGTPELQKEFVQTKNRGSALQKELDQVALEVLELNRRYMALDARLKARSDSGRGPGAMAAVDYLLSQRNLGKIAGIRGTVSELAGFRPEHSTALTIAAGGRFQAMVVETDQVAEECIKLLRSEKRGRATFLPLNKMLPGRPRGKSLVASQSSGSLGFALDLVKFDEELQGAFWYVFGETVVMDDLAHARSQMGGVRLVTLQGELIEATGAISGGYLDTGANARGADNASELKRLGDELRAKGQTEADLRAEIASLDGKVRTMADELAKRTAETNAHQTTRSVLDGELTAARDRLAEVKKRAEAARVARSQAEADLEKAIQLVTTREKAVAEAKAALALHQQAYLGNLPEALSTKIRSLQEANQAANDERLAISQQLEATRASIAAAETAIAARHTEFETLKTTRSQKEKQSETVVTSRDEAKAALETMRAVESKQLARVHDQSEEKRKLDGRRLELVDQVARAQESLRTKATLADQEQVRLQQAEQRLAEAEAALKELPEPEADEKPVTVDELKRTIQTVTSQLDSMGSVNLRALEEYDGEKARLDEFQGEVNRISTEKTDLLHLVGEIEKKKRVKLVEVVGSVDINFRQIYSELSGGGIGEIALENQEDPLAGGLLIKASPVGKNIQRLEQLSGGEKSLASLAFVFALQRHDPSPLYVFDEVDMSLDGVNAENVGRLLRRNAERAQFIVISLRKVTLKFAHRLFGVTMHGDGCSRVVGLKLDEIVDVDEKDRAPEALAPLVPGAA
ncbi:MAG: chromosome segregation protein SMC [Thermoplasmata archaeon]|nr:chromosome segregation protein SMC [Thermoplasmata archaeon]